ncbi:TPA: DUF192 domain-containing protein [Candidatus Woesearchaeota archaeon]|nr:DUF192 domain-containing protein [Candidatus Woesearchaeota archaeon]
MKNTLIPLDMFFVDSKGMIITIRENVPPCRADPCPLYSSDGKILYTIETNAGYAKLHGLKAGSRVIVPNVQAQ